MGHPWDSLFYRFKGLGNCISKLVNNHNISYDDINERNPTVWAATPIAELPTVEIVEDPTSGTYTRKVCVPLIAPKTILRKDDGAGNRIALVGNKAKLLISKHFLEEVKPIVPLSCEWNAEIIPYSGWENFVDMTVGITGTKKEANAIFFGGAMKTEVVTTPSGEEDIGYWNYILDQNVEHGLVGGLTYTLITGVNGDGNPSGGLSENALFLVTDNIFSDTATYPVTTAKSPLTTRNAQVDFLQFSQSWRGDGLILDLLSRMGLNDISDEVVSLDLIACRLSGYDLLKQLVRGSYDWMGGNPLGEIQWEATLAKNPWAGNWYLNGKFALSVGYTQVSISSTHIDVSGGWSLLLGARDSANVGGADLWGKAGFNASIFYIYYTVVDDSERMIHLVHNADVPRVTSMSMMVEINGYVRATQGGKVSFRVRASDRWKIASSAEKQACYWENGNPYCWLSTGVEAVYIDATTGQSFQLTPTETLGVLTRYELEASPYEILGADEESATIEVFWSGTNNHIGAQNFDELYAREWAYNFVNVDAEESCSFKNWY